MDRFYFPSIWLLGFLIVTALLWVLSPTIAFHFDGHREAAVLMFAIGAVPIFAATREMERAKTTFVCRESPEALVTAGFFPSVATQSIRAC